MKEFGESDQSYKAFNQARFSNFKIIHYSRRDNAPLPLPENPKTLQDVIGTISMYTKLAFKNENSLLLSYIGATGRGKNTFGELINIHLEKLISKSIPNKRWNSYDELEDINKPTSLINVDWEEHRSFLYESGAFPDLPDILTPFSNDHLKLIQKAFEFELAQALKDGGVILATKPAGTYGFVWDKSRGEFTISLVERDFGPETLRKLASLQTPFNNLDKGNVFYLANIAVIGSPFVTHILTRYRDALQRAGTNLEAANEIQRAFKKPLFETIDELVDKQEGGSMRGVAKTNEAIQKVLEEYWWNSVDFALHPNIRHVLSQIQLSANDDELVDMANLIRIDTIKKEAWEVAKFLSDNPSKHLYADIMRSIIYEYTLNIIHQSTDLQTGHFERSLPLQPLMSIVVRNSPSVSGYKGNIKEIRRVLNKYGL